MSQVGPFVTDFGQGRHIYPPSGSSNPLTYDVEIQKYLPVALDSYFIDTVTGATSCRTIIVGVAGNVTLEFFDGTTATIPFVAGDPRHRVRAVRVLSAGTTATGIFWGY